MEARLGFVALQKRHLATLPVATFNAISRSSLFRSLAHP